jgi:hypothetical protein
VFTTKTRRHQETLSWIGCGWLLDVSSSFAVALSCIHLPVGPPQGGAFGHAVFREKKCILLIPAVFPLAVRALDCEALIDFASEAFRRSRLDAGHHRPVGHRASNLHVISSDHFDPQLPENNAMDWMPRIV